MEATIIKLDNVTTATPMVVRSATFEEAFGDYSEARGRGRARRKKRKLERIANKREVRTERRKLKGDRQEERIARRKKRKQSRQDIRDEQQEARMERRNKRYEARQSRRADREEDDEELDTSTTQQGGGGSDDQQGGGGSDDQQGGGGYDDQQGGGGYADDQQGGGGYADDQQGGGGAYTETEDWASAPQGFNEDDEEAEDSGYGDSQMYDTPYVQEESEFADDSYFNVEGMDGKGAVLPSAVADNVEKLKNNERAYKDLSERRNEMARVGNNTKGIELRMEKCYGRICELREQLDNFVNADGNPNERRRRKSALATKLGLKKRKRERVEYGGSEVPVEKDLNPEFSNQRIVVPASSNFDAYSDLGRPVIVNGVTQSDYSDYSSDLLTDSAEPTTVELFSSADGSSGTTAKTIMSIAIGIGVGALAIYLAKRKGWI